MRTLNLLTEVLREGLLGISVLRKKLEGIVVDDSQTG
jgi:hypothetical protein